MTLQPPDKPKSPPDKFRQIWVWLGALGHTQLIYWSFSILSFFGKYLYAKNLRHWLTPSKGIGDSRILLSVGREHMSVIHLKVYAIYDKNTIFSLELNWSFILKYLYCGHTTLRPTKFTMVSLGMSGCDWVHLAKPKQQLYCMPSFIGY